MSTIAQTSLSLGTDSAPPCLEAVTAAALRHPGAPALRFGDRTLTYGDLDRRSTAIARRLRERGIGSDTPVGLCLPRCFDMVAAALAAWKAGAAYVPLDPCSPPQRLGFIAADAQIPLIIANSTCSARLQYCGTGILSLDDEDASPAENEVSTAPGELAYIIYTSGSTGAPKGVEITHASLTHLIDWHLDAFRITPSDRASHVAGLGFDASVWELWPYLAAGACVHLADDVTRLSPELLRDWMFAQRITVGFAPTALAERMLFLDWPRDTALRLLLTGGDTLHHHPPAGLPFTLVNNYGPTECTVVATSCPVAPAADSGLPSIGAPISRTRIYLLDELGRQVAPDSPGEIYIAGPSLARGYRNSPDLTAARFIPNPFDDEPGSRLYKTGDLARRLPGGNLQFLGRADSQIKLRGYRIEPSEIVAALNRQLGVLDSLVLAREDGSGEKRLLAYLVAAPHFAPPLSEFRDALRATLPDYMIPAAFIRIDAFPLTPHGKIDTGALPDPSAANSLADPAPPASRTPTEEQVTRIVGDLLQLDQVALDDNFFMLGGHSLLGTQLIARLRKQFGVQIGLRALFAAPTIAALSSEIDRLSESS